MNYNSSEVQFGGKKKIDENASAICGARFADERDRGERVHAESTGVAEEIAGGEGDLRNFGTLGNARLPSASVGAAANDSRLLRFSETVVPGAISGSGSTGRSKTIGNGRSSGD